MPEKKERMKPVIILPPGAMHKDDIQQLRDNDICVVECEEPESVRFVEPPPAGYEACEYAAIELFRKLMRSKGYHVDRQALAEMYVDCLVKGTRLGDVEEIAPVKRARKGPTDAV